MEVPCYSHVWPPLYIALLTHSFINLLIHCANVHRLLDSNGYAFSLSGAVAAFLTLCLTLSACLTHSLSHTLSHSLALPVYLAFLWLFFKPLSLSTSVSYSLSSFLTHSLVIWNYLSMSHSLREYRHLPLSSYHGKTTQNSLPRTVSFTPFLSHTLFASIFLPVSLSIFFCFISIVFQTNSLSHSLSVWIPWYVNSV